MRSSSVLLRSLAATACLVAAPLLVGCGASNSGGVAVNFGGTKIQEQFGNATEQQTATNRELTALLGHPIEVTVDQTLSVRWSKAAHENVKKALAGLTRELKAIKTSKPEVFDEIASKITRVAYVHSTIVDHTETIVDVQNGSLTLVVIPADDGCACATIQASMAIAHDAERVRRFENATVEAIADKDLPKFYDVLSRHAIHGDTPSKVTDDEVRTLERLIALHRRLGKATGTNKELASMREAVGKTLGSAGASLAYAYKFHGGELGGIHGGKPFRRFETAWCNFFRTDYWSLPATERNEALRGVFRVWQQDRAFPGIDRTAMASDIVGRWVAAGSPVTGTTKAARTDDGSTFDAVLCPRAKTEEGTLKPAPEGCSTELYGFLKADDSRLSAFVRTVMVKRDGRVTEALLSNLPKAETKGDTAVAATSEETPAGRVAVTTQVP